MQRRKTPATSMVGGRRRQPARPGRDNRGVTDERKKRGTRTDPLAAYRRIRKPMPPPEKVIPDKRRKIDEEDAHREIEEQ
jgi:hypothetical protein